MGGYVLSFYILEQTGVLVLLRGLQLFETGPGVDQLFSLLCDFANRSAQEVTVCGGQGVNQVRHRGGLVIDEAPNGIGGLSPGVL